MSQKWHTFNVARPLIPKSDSGTNDRPNYLYAIADWLAECGITSVAMESPGVYWIPLYQVVLLIPGRALVASSPFVSVVFVSVWRHQW